MEATEDVKKFCETCSKEKDSDKCMSVDGKSFCCGDCVDKESKGEKKPAICEFC